MKKIWNWNRRPRPPAFDRIKNFDYHDLIAKHCYFGCSRSPDVDGIKIFEITRPQNINVLQPGYLYQKFWSHQHQENLSIWNNNVLQWGHDDLILSKAGGLGRPFWFHILFNKAFYVALGCSFFTPGVFWFRLYFAWEDQRQKLNSTIFALKHQVCCIWNTTLWLTNTVH